MPSSKNYKSQFNSQWLNTELNPEWASWLRESKTGKESAMCIICSKDFSLSNMGSQAIRSHIVSKKHKYSLQHQNSSFGIKQFFTKNSETVLKNSADHSIASTSSDSPIVLTSTIDTRDTQSTQPNMMNYMYKNDVLKSEIHWVLTAAGAHLSTRAAEYCQNEFNKIFKDSTIAKNFGVCKDKHSYLTTHGIAPYFKKKLSDEILLSPFISISFDEALNKVAQKSQMDFHIRFLEIKSGLTCTRYLTSEFLTSTKAPDLLEHFFIGLGDKIDKKKILSVAMDGPNVNWKMLSLLKEELNSSPESPKLIEFGTCSLHVIHGALKTGHKASKWNIIEYLRATYYLFHDSPTRKGIYTAVTGSEVFPAKFCCTRWVENVNATSTAIRVLPDIRKYVHEIKELKTSKVFGKVKVFLEDPLLPAKLGFFQGIAKKLERFLTKFQSDNPMTPFLFDDLLIITKSLYKLILRPEVYKSKSINYKDLLKLDISKQEYLRPVSELDLFNSAKDGIRNAHIKLTIAQIHLFREQCFTFIKSVISKIWERSPLKYNITRGLSCISPQVMLSSRKMSRLDTCLEEFIKLQRLGGLTADSIKDEYERITDHQLVVLHLKKFDENTDRLDQLFNTIYDTVKVEVEFKQFVSMILILFHGNANVERGFSENKHCLQDNLLEKTLVSKRIVSNQVSIVGGPSGIEKSKELLLSCRNAHSFYKEDLKMKSEVEKQKNENRKRKSVIDNEIKEIEIKKRKILEDSEKAVLELNEDLTSLKKICDKIKH